MSTPAWTSQVIPVYTGFKFKNPSHNNQTSLCRWTSDGFSQKTIFDALKMKSPQKRTKMSLTWKPRTTEADVASLIQPAHQSQYGLVRIAGRACLWGGAASEGGNVKARFYCFLSAALEALLRKGGVSWFSCRCSPAVCHRDVIQE